MQKICNKMSRLYSRYGISLITTHNLKKLQLNQLRWIDEGILAQIDSSFHGQYWEARSFSKSQIRQDMLALAISKFKRNGFFVEFGATNGVKLSNTHLLEKEFNWSGILAEPSKCYHKQLQSNRNAHIDTRCVWSKTGETLTFNEVGVLSTIDLFSKSDLHAPSREKGKKYQVETVTLNDLLDQYNAPQDIDYLSIDTEGSEYSILESFDFTKHNFNVITVEHNFTPDREKIFNLLTSKGYRRSLEFYSQFDDWYVLYDI